MIQGEVVSMADGTVKPKKDSVSINTCIGDDLFYTLEMFCAITIYSSV